MNSTIPNPGPRQGLNTLEDQVLRHAYATGQATMTTFPEVDPQLVAAAIESLHLRGYVVATLVLSNGNKPGYAFAAIDRVLPIGAMLCALKGQGSGRGFQFVLLTPLEERVLLHACTSELPNFDSFPDVSRHDLGEAFKALQQYGCADVTLLPNTSDSPEEFAFGEIVRVTPRGMVLSKSLA